MTRHYCEIDLCPSGLCDPRWVEVVSDVDQYTPSAAESAQCGTAAWCDIEVESIDGQQVAAGWSEVCACGELVDLDAVRRAVDRTLEVSDDD